MAKPMVGKASLDNYNPEMQAKLLAMLPSEAGSVEQPTIDYGNESEAQVRARVRQMLEKSLQGEESDLGTQQALLKAKLEQSPQVDLSGFFDMARLAGANPNVGAKYKAPENLDVQALLNPINKQRGAIADDKIAYLKTLLEDKKADKESRLASQFMTKNTQDVLREVQKDAVKINQSLATAKSQYNTVYNEIKSGDFQRIKRALSNYARLMGEKGVLTDQDVERQLARSMDTDISKAALYVTAHNSDQLDPVIVNNLLTSLRTAQNGIYNQHKEKASGATEIYSYNPYANKDVIKNMFSASVKDIPEAEDKAVDELKSLDEKQKRIQELLNKKNHEG
jgi:hypothetical protein